MTYDIYGQHLKPGYCEVHPDHYGSYPCQICIDEAQQYYAEQQRQDEEFLYRNEYEEMCRHDYEGFLFECRQDIFLEVED